MIIMDCMNIALFWVFKVLCIKDLGSSHDNHSGGCKLHVKPQLTLGRLTGAGNQRPLQPPPSMHLPLFCIDLYCAFATLGKKGEVRAAGLVQKAPSVLN